MADPKAIESSIGLASEAGTRAAAGFGPVADGENPEILTDRNGRVWTRQVPAPGFPTRWQQGKADAFTNTAVVRATAAKLESIAGYVNPATSTTRTYIQVYDKATAPGGGDAPVWEVALDGAGSFAWAQGWEFTLGVQIAFSTVAGSYTSAGNVGKYNATGYAP